MNRHRHSFLSVFAGEKGQTVAEYSILLALIAVATITAITALGTGMSGQFTAITAGLRHSRLHRPPSATS
jgi:Flp pilus assembly pilin Flp